MQETVIMANEATDLRNTEELSVCMRHLTSTRGMVECFYALIGGQSSGGIRWSCVSVCVCYSFVDFSAQLLKTRN